MSRLAAALSERGKEVWVDVEGVRDAEVFPEALRGAIESSDAFAFVISPDAVKSAFCVEEIEHAARLNKRIIPLALRLVPDEEIPEEVRFRNWIPAGEDSDFAATVERLLKALDTDLEWEREHSRVTVRALEWDRSRRDRSFLLRGADLRSAEAWLAAGAGKDPGPTALETEYVVAGRRAAALRQRGLLVASLVVAAVSVGLLIFALISRGEAVSQALTSDAERVGAQGVNEKNVDLAMLYAVAGVKLQNRLQTRSDLLTVLQNNPDAIRLLRPSQNEITSLAVNGGGQLLATGDSGGIVRFEDMSHWTASGRPLALKGSIPQEAMMFSPDGRTLAVLSETGSPEGPNQAGRTNLYSIDVATRRVRLLGSWGGVFSSVPYPGASLAYDRSGRHLALSISTNSANGSVAADTLTLIDPSTGRTIWQRQYPLLAGGLQLEARLVFAPNGTLVTSAQQGDTLIWNPRTGRVERRFPIGGQPAINAAGDRLALAINSPSLATATSRIALLDLRTGHYRFLPAGLPNAWLRGFAFTPDGESIVSATTHGQVDVWDVASGTILATIPPPGGDRASEVLAPSGRTVLVGSEAGTVVAYDLSGSRRLGRAFQWGPPAQSCAAAPCIAINRQSNLMATDQGDGSVALIALPNLRLAATLPARNGPFAPAIAFFPDGRTLLTGGSTGQLTLWDTRSHTVLRTIKIDAPVYWGAVSPGGRLLAVQTQTSTSPSAQVQVRPVTGGRPLWTHPLQDGTGGLYFSPDGREVAALGCCTSLSTVASWNARTGRELFSRRLANHATAIAFSPDSRLLAVGTEDGHVLFWDARGGVEAAPALRVSTGNVAQIAFSPDGSTMAAASHDGSTTLWDLRSGTQIGGSFPERPNVITSPVFAPNGKLVIDYLADAAEWPMDVASWERFACQVAGRNLTQAEWRDVLPNRSYMQVCPANG
ncbi:MAG: PQQ-binding-like beta-propeller repeat protein [Solirubrobacterales bacterium]|nr:PQQ-binding-like beta-propeller repeat protein [Solirubrobacterales bacterium]